VSELTIFIVGTLIFATTVAGSVMVGGLTLTRRHFEQNDQLGLRDSDHAELPDGLPGNIKY
jgi:hypothetical protein